MIEVLKKILLNIKNENNLEDFYQPLYFIFSNITQSCEKNINLYFIEPQIVCKFINRDIMILKLDNLKLEIVTFDESLNGYILSFTNQDDKLKIISFSEVNVDSEVYDMDEIYEEDLEKIFSKV